MRTKLALECKGGTVNVCAAYGLGAGRVKIILTYLHTQQGVQYRQTPETGILSDLLHSDISEH
jgi:hypothetical protein